MVKNLPANAGDMGSIPELEEPLEEEMTTHSSILARESPWTEEPGGLWSMGSQRVEQDSATKQQIYISPFQHEINRNIYIYEIFYHFCFHI